ncbi:MAG: hypothetical protein ABEJ40_10295 [Haloarculaceae archaeon]
MPPQASPVDPSDAEPLVRHLEAALDRVDDETARYHIREAMQLAVFAEERPVDED